MQILNLELQDPNTIECLFENGGRQHKVLVKVITDGEIRGLHLTNISEDERWTLYNAPEGLDFARQIWKFYDGEPLTFPIALKVGRVEHDELLSRGPGAC